MNSYRTNRATAIGFVSLLLAGLWLLAMPASRAHAQTPAELDDVRKLIREANETFVQLIENITDAQWTFKSGKFRRTIGEEAEHIALAENDLQGVVANALQADKDLAKAKTLAGKEKMVRTQMLSPQKRAEFFKPPNRLKSKAEVQEFYRRAHRSLLRSIELAPDLEGHIYQHPNKKYGDLTALQWYYYIAYHKLRHCEQIKQIMAQPDLPGGAQKSD